MAKTKDISPKLKIPTAQKELELPLGTELMGQRAGGLSLFSDSFKRGYGNAVFGSDSRGIWLGAADFVNAPFSVDMDGNVVAVSLKVGGFVSTLAWTATDRDTATWASGTIKTSDGTVYTIAGGNTGNILAKTFVYLDPATSTTVLQTSTTATDAAGNGKVLIATIEIGAVGSECIMTIVNAPGTTVNGSGIVTGSIAADKISVSSLSAISANLGTITAGSISGITIAIGTGNSIFKADSNGIYLGNATFASAPFQVNMSGDVIMKSWTLKSPNGNTSIVGVNSGVSGTGGGIVFPNLSGVYFFTTDSHLGGAVYEDDSNRLVVANLYGNIRFVTGSGGTPYYDSYMLSTGDWLFNGATFLESVEIDGSLYGYAGTLSIGDGVSIASGKNLVFAGTQGSINCGDIDCNAIQMNSHELNGVTNISCYDVNHNGHNINNCATANITTINNTTLNGNAIYYWNLYHYSVGFKGDPFPILASIAKSTPVPSKNSKWAELDHAKLHSEIYAQKVEADGKKTDVVDVGKLIMIQTEAINQMEERIKILEEQLLLKQKISL